MAIGFKGTSISDIEQGAEDALEEDIANLSPASNSVAGNLDGGAGKFGVETQDRFLAKKYSGFFNGTETVSVSGSGVCTELLYSWDTVPDSVTLSIDGNTALDLNNPGNENGFITSTKNRNITFDNAIDNFRRTENIVFSFDSSITLDVSVTDGRVEIYLLGWLL